MIGRKIAALEECFILKSVGNNKVNIRFFPDQFLQRDECFGLFKLGDDGELDLPVTVERDARIPFHIMHSDPDLLAKSGHLPFSFDRYTQSLLGKLATSNPYALR